MAKRQRCKMPAGTMHVVVCQAVAGGISRQAYCSNQGVCHRQWEAAVHRTEQKSKDGYPLSLEMSVTGHVECVH